MRWKNVLRGYFTFNRRERRGIVALLSLLFLLIGVRATLRFVGPPEQIHSTMDTELLISELQPNKKEPEIPTKSIQWFSFDPNSVSIAELEQLGVEQGLAQRWENYRNKGGRFDDEEDVLRLYGIDSAWVALASPYMRFPEQSGAARKIEEAKKSKAEQKEIIDLNRADTNALKTIRGVGGFYARQIVELRERLGGYFTYDQLLDVNKIRDETITTISERTFIDSSAVRTIDINHCSVDPLGRHPYLTWKQAKVIVSYRQQHGAYDSVEQIMDTKVVSDSVYLKIAPYLRTE